MKGFRPGHELVLDRSLLLVGGQLPLFRGDLMAGFEETGRHDLGGGLGVKVVDGDLEQFPAKEAALDGVRVIHLSGITPALSDSCLALMDRLVHAPRGCTLSFDLNWRPQLWTGRDPAVLCDLAAAADIVFVGADEAKLVWDVEEPAAIRALLTRTDKTPK